MILNINHPEKKSRFTSTFKPTFDSIGNKNAVKRTSPKEPTHFVKVVVNTGIIHYQWYQHQNTLTYWLWSYSDPKHPEKISTHIHSWLVVGPPLWKIWTSIRMISNPIFMGTCQKWQPFTTNQHSIHQFFPQLGPTFATFPGALAPAAPGISPALQRIPSGLEAAGPGVVGHGHHGHHAAHVTTPTWLKFDRDHLFSVFFFFFIFEMFICIHTHIYIYILYIYIICRYIYIYVIICKHYLKEPTYEKDISHTVTYGRVWKSWLLLDEKRHSIIERSRWFSSEWNRVSCIWFSDKLLGGSSLLVSGLVHPGDFHGILVGASRPLK